MNQPQYGPVGPPQPRRSSGNVVVWILLLVFVVPMLLCGGLCAGFVVLSRSAVHEVQVAIDESFHEVEAFQLAWQQVRTAKEVTSRLGEPVEDGFPSQFQHHESVGEGANAEFRYPITGPNGGAQVHVVGERIEGQWWYETIAVTFDDGETVELAFDPRPIQLD